jgi:hypothetical protein
VGIASAPPLYSSGNYLEETDGLEASREERPGNGTYEERQPQPRVPLLSGGKHPTLGERFEEELHRS